jgi:hypothetical protein
VFCVLPWFSYLHGSFSFEHGLLMTPFVICFPGGGTSERATQEYTHSKTRHCKEGHNCGWKERHHKASEEDWLVLQESTSS